MPLDFLPAQTTLKGIRRNREAQVRGRGQATGIKVNDALKMAIFADSPAHTPPQGNVEQPTKAKIRQARDAALIRVMSNGMLRISKLSG